MRMQGIYIPTCLDESVLNFNEESKIFNKMKKHIKYTFVFK